MKKVIGYCFVMFFVLSSPKLLAGGNSRLSNLSDAGDKLALEISGYRSWTRVNPEPLNLPAPLDLLCRAPTLDERAETSRNPHRRKFFTVYVNESGRDAMMTAAEPKFPQGSIIVKEKLLDKGGSKAELLTAMIKRGPGFNPTNGDWEYFVLNGEGVKVEARGKLENCQACHSTKKETDYVFRSYLPGNVRQKLR